MDSHDILITFAAAASLGVFLLILAARLRISAIVVLLLGGILAGPEFLGLVHPDHLGASLNTIISIAVGVILFEGGLTLNINGYRQSSREILGVLTTGVLVTWLASAALVKLVFGFPWTFCLLSASLIIVTGPTVIGPLLHRIRVTRKINHILHWEGVLIDPIGVFIALLCFEYYVSSGSQGLVVFDFLLRFAAGAGLGMIFGIVLYQVLKRNWIPGEYLNISVLAWAILTFTVADLVRTETGLLSVTIAGLVVGYKRPPQLARIIEYKVELKDMFIGLLFVLLAANLELAKFAEYGTTLIFVVVAIMFVVRPLNIFLSTRKSSLNLREKMFLSYIAPRGIVAASMASICAFHLKNLGYEEGAFLETFTYSVIAGTVVFQGFTAGIVGKALGVLEPKPKGWVIIGAHELARSIARFIEANGHSAVLVDTNPREVRVAQREGLTALYENGMNIDPENRIEFYGVGYFMALTTNPNLNCLLCQRWRKLLDKPVLFRWDGSQHENGEMDEEVVVGTPVWQSLPMTSSGNGRGETLEVAADLASYPYPEEVLMCFYEDEIYPGVPEGKKGDGTFLTLRHVVKEEKQHFPIKENGVLFSNDASLEPLYHRMLDIVAKSVPHLDRKTLYVELLQREDEFTSLIGHGISLPHAYAAGLQETQMLVARLIPGIPCKHTGSDIQVVFMLLSPEDQPVRHLNLISDIAKFIMQEEVRQAILAAEDAASLFRVIDKGV